MLSIEELRGEVERGEIDTVVVATGAATPAGGRGGARVRRDVRLRARVLSPARDLRGGPCEALPRPDALGPVHPRLPRPRDDLRRAAHPADPERDAGRGDPR